MGRIQRTAHARRDYSAIWDYIADDNPSAADRLLRRFDQKLRLAADQPGIGHPRDDLSPGLRSLRVGRYLLFYRQVPNGIELIRVLHGARDLPRLFGHGPSG